MDTRTKGSARRIAVLAIAASMLGVGVVSVAEANNLDRRTATDFARDVARKDCKDTSGCQSYSVRGLHRVSRHKAVGKIVVISTKNGVKFECTRQLVIKLDHFTGDLNYGVSSRRCNALGAA